MSNSFRRNINSILLAFMVLAQLALAQHSTVHVTEQIQIASYEHTDNGHDVPTKAPTHDKKCSICLLSKSFSYALSQAGVLPVVLNVESVVFAADYSFLSVRQVYRANGARAPPSFLI